MHQQPANQQSGWRPALGLALGLMLPAAWPAPAPAQPEQADQADAEANNNNTNNTDADAGRPTPDQVMQDLLRQRSSGQGNPKAAPADPNDDVAGEPAAPAIAPDREPAVQYVPSRGGLPAARVDVDPGILGPTPGQPQPRLIREGAFVVERVGRLTRVDDRSERVLVFDNPPGKTPLPPMLLLPCRYLAGMDQAAQRSEGAGRAQGNDAAGGDASGGTASGGGGGVWFKLSGQVTAYRGVNYLLVTALSGIRTQPPPPPASPPAPIPGAPSSEASSNPTDADSATSTGSPAADTNGEGDTPGGSADPKGTLEPEAADLVRDLLKRRDNQARGALPTVPVDAVRPRGELAGVAPEFQQGRGTGATSGNTFGGGATSGGSASGGVLREGTMLMNRAGRLRRSADGADVLLVFDADSAQAPEPPVIVQPCRMLAEMEDLVAQRGRSVRLLVSGELQQYHGANYLLPTVMKIAVDQGNLQP